MRTRGSDRTKRNRMTRKKVNSEVNETGQVELVKSGQSNDREVQESGNQRIVESEES